MTPLAGAVLGAVQAIISRVWPDPSEQAKATLALAQLEAEGELKRLQAEVDLALEQAKVNAIEAQSKLWWQHWRPAVGWVCAFGLAWQYIIRDLYLWVAAAQEWPLPPDLDVTELVLMLVGMLGIGGMRSFDKMTRSQR